MKILSLFAAFCFLTHFSAPIVRAETAPLQWSEIETGMILKLVRDLKVDDTLTLHKGSTLAVNQQTPIDGIQVQQMELKLFPCDSSLDQRKIPMTILDETYGFELKQQCQIELYLEFKDFYKASFFEIGQR